MIELTSLNSYKFVLMLSVFITTSCKSTLPIEYQLVNDILEEQVDENAKTFFTYNCGDKVSFKELYVFILNCPINNDNKGVFASSYVKKYKPYINSKTPYAFGFNTEDINYFKKHIDSVPNSCWDATKIKDKNIAYFSKKEMQEMFTIENMTKYVLKEIERPIKEEDQTIYLSKPLINETKDKAIFLFRNNKVPMAHRPFAAVSKKINDKWVIVGYIYQGYY